MPHLPIPQTGTLPGQHNMHSGNNVPDRLPAFDEGRLKDLDDLVSAFAEGRYADSLRMADRMMTANFHVQLVYRLAISACISLKCYIKASGYENEYLRRFRMSAEDCLLFGYIYHKLNQPHETARLHNLALELDDKNATCYKTMGIYHFAKEEFDQALLLFNKAKELDKD
jgi:tetratricopeptide (TPR) repeat protein